MIGDAQYLGHHLSSRWLLTRAIPHASLTLKAMWLDPDRGVFIAVPFFGLGRESKKRQNPRYPSVQEKQVHCRDQARG